MPLEVLGYSERGMINAFFHEMMCSGDSLERLKAFLHRACIFPRINPRSADGPEYLSLKDVAKATVWIEQSFSDFGDADALILLDGPQRACVYVEAKVKTAQTLRWSMNNEWATFLAMVQPDHPELDPKERRRQKTSNLLIQLYRKMRLTRRLTVPMEEFYAHEADRIAIRWSLGNNPVVRRAAETLKTYCTQAWYLALVPDSQQNVELFFDRELPVEMPPHPSLREWNTTNWGYITWSQLEAFCRHDPGCPWPNTLANFMYNQGQIYGPSPPLG